MADFNSNIAIILEAVNRAGGELEKTRKQIELISQAQGKQQSTTNSLAKSNQGFGKILSEVNAGLAQHVEKLGAVGRVAVGVAGPVAAAAGAFIAFGVAAVNAATQMGEYQEKTALAAEASGLSIRTTVALQVASANVGREFSQIQPSLTIFTRKVGEAAAGNKDLEKTFNKLGVGIRDVATGELRSMDDILGDVAARLKHAGSAAERNRVVFELFGRGGASAIAILSQSIEENARIAEEKGILLTASQQKIAEAADVATDQLKQSFTGLKNQILLSLTPAGTTIMNWGTNTIDWLKKVGDAIHKEVLGPFEELGKVSERLKRESAPATVGEATVEIGKISMLGTQAPEQNRKLRAMAEDQLLALQKMIPLLDYQRSIGAITAEEEAKKLLAMKAQALTAKEIFIIQQKAAELFSSVGLGRLGERPYGPMPPEGFPQGGYRDITFQPSTRGEMPNVDFKLSGLDDEMTQFLAQFEDFESILSRAASVTGEADDALVGFLGTMKLTSKTALEIGIEAAKTLKAGMRQSFEQFSEELVFEHKSFWRALGDLSRNLGKVLFKVVTGGILGGIGLQGGGRWQPIRAQAGVMMAGTRGIDSQLVSIGRGEGVFTNAVMDKLDRFLNSKQANGQSQQPRVSGPVTNTFLVNNTFPNLLSGDRRSMRQATEEGLASIIKQVNAGSSVRRFG